MPVVGFWLRQVGKLTGRPSRARFSTYPYKEIADRPRDAQCTMSVYFVMWLRIRVLGFGLALKASYRFQCSERKREISHRKISRWDKNILTSDIRTTLPNMLFPDEFTWLYGRTTTCVSGHSVVLTVECICLLEPHLSLCPQPWTTRQERSGARTKAVWSFEGYRLHSSGQIPSPCCIHCFRSYI